MSASDISSPKPERSSLDGYRLGYAKVLGEVAPSRCDIATIAGATGAVSMKLSGSADCLKYHLINA